MKSPGPYSSSSPGPQQPNLMASSLHSVSTSFLTGGGEFCAQTRTTGLALVNKVTEPLPACCTVSSPPPPHCKMRFPRTGPWCPLFFTPFTPRLPCDSDGKESACSAGDPGSIPGSGRSPGEGNGTPLQYPGLENPRGKGARWATVHGVAKRRT